MYHRVCRRIWFFKILGLQLPSTPNKHEVYVDISSDLYSFDQDGEMAVMAAAYAIMTQATGIQRYHPLPFSTSAKAKSSVTKGR